MEERTRCVEEAKPRIILVGPDCGGKSTLAKRLGEHYGVEVIPNRRIKDPIRALRAVLETADEFMTEKSFIMDQWPYPVDIVYNEVLWGEESPMSGVHGILRRHFQQHGVLVIHVTASEETITERYKTRGDELWSLRQILAIRDAYNEYMEILGLWHVTIDTTDKPEEEVFEEAVQAIEEAYRLRGAGFIADRSTKGPGVV